MNNPNINGDNKVKKSGKNYYLKDKLVLEMILFDGFVSSTIWGY